MLLFIHWDYTGIIKVIIKVMKKQTSVTICWNCFPEFFYKKKNAGSSHQEMNISKVVNSRLAGYLAVFV